MSESSKNHHVTAISLANHNVTAISLANHHSTAISFASESLNSNLLCQCYLSNLPLHSDHPFDLRYHGSKAEQSKDSARAANLIIDPSVWLISSEEEENTSTTSFLLAGFILIALIMLSTYWFKAVGDIRAVPTLGLCHSSVVLASAYAKTLYQVISTKIISGSAFTIRMVLSSLVPAVVSLPVSTLCAPILWSALLLAIRMAPFLAEQFPIPAVPVPFMVTKPWVPYSGAIDGSNLLPRNAGGTYNGPCTSRPVPYAQRKACSRSCKQFKPKPKNRQWKVAPKKHTWNLVSKPSICVAYHELHKLPKADRYIASRTLHPSSPSKRNVFNIVWPPEDRVRLHRDVKGNPGPVIWDSGASFLS